jgi:hypothetical protein
VTLRSYRNAGILAIAARTCAADHTPPRGAEMPRSFNSFAIERSEFAPAVRMSSMTGARSAARIRQREIRPSGRNLGEDDVMDHGTTALTKLKEEMRPSPPPANDSEGKRIRFRA